MMNCLLITDYNWDNMAIISKRLSYLPENIKINLLFSKQRQNIIKICDNHSLPVLRRSETDPLKIINYIDFCIIFTDFVEYNTYPAFFIDVCQKNKVLYLTFSNFTLGYFLNGEFCKDKFKKTILKLKKNRKEIDETLEYCELVKYKRNKQDTDVNSAIDRLRNIYSELNLEKERRSIILIDS